MKLIILVIIYIMEVHNLHQIIHLLIFFISFQVIDLNHFLQLFIYMNMVMELKKI